MPNPQTPESPPPLAGAPAALGKAILQRAYRSDDVAVAKRLVQDLARRLEADHPSAAESVREGPEETLNIEARLPRPQLHMRTFLLLFIALALGVAIASSYAPSLAAGGLLHPARHEPHSQTPANCSDRQFRGSGVILRGWHCRAEGPNRGTLVYLHGIADNRDSSVGVIRRLSAQGVDVVAYDSRAHGASDGDVCTYGYFEKDDLHRVIDALSPGPLALFGTSLGAAVALQEAATDDRVSGVIAAEVFSDLETIARERAPAFLPEAVLVKAFHVAEQRAAFSIRDVSPARAASSIRVPVLLIHGEADILTSPEHSRRVFAALGGPKQLVLVPNAGHNQSLRDPAVWRQVDRWLSDVLPQVRTPN